MYLDLILLSCVTALSMLLITFIKENFYRKNPPPGPYRFPIVGSMIQVNMINSKVPYLAFDQMREKYGDVMCLQLGSLFAVVLSSYDMMQEYMTKMEFSGRFFNEWVAERSFHKELGILFTETLGPWSEIRRFSLRALKDHGFGRRDMIQSVIQSELIDVVDELKASIQKSNGIHQFDGHFTLSILNVLWSMLAGKRYEHTDKKLLTLLNIMRTLMESGNQGNSFLMVYPKWKDYFPDWTGMTLQRNGYTKITDFFREVIEERRHIGAYKSNPESLVDAYLQQIDVHAGETDTIFTDEQLITLMFDLFLAGSETSAHTLGFGILYMLLHPDIQKKVQDEIDSVIPRGAFVTLEHESKLDYVRATIAEIHRLGTVLPIMPLRKTVQNTTCEGYFIPKGTYVVPNIYSVFHDEKHWIDPENFRPERFLDSEGKYKPDDWLKPFGFGRRICLGENLAQTSLFFYFTTLMQNFTLQPVPNEPLPTMEPKIGFTNGPHPFKALVEIRA